MNESFFAGALLGLLASPHCMTMCGPLSWQAQSGIPLRTLPYFTGLYHIGRIGVYLAMGKAIGALAHWTALTHAAGIAAGVFLLYTAVTQWRDQQRCCPTARLLGLPLVKRRWGLAGPWYFRAIGLGALNGALPCGMVYAAILAAASFEGPLQELYLVGFGLATLVPLLTFRYLWRRLVSFPAFKWVQGTLVFLVAGWMLLQGINGLLRPTEYGAHMPSAVCLPTF
jgi:sulfite exporter TauE/SafE